MVLNREDYCDECWLIVSSENEGLVPQETIDSAPGKSPTITDDKSAKSTTIVSRITVKEDTVEMAMTEGVTAGNGGVSAKFITVKGAVSNEMKSFKDEEDFSRKLLLEKSRTKTVDFDPGKHPTKIADVDKSLSTLGTSLTYKSKRSKTSTMCSTASFPTILSTPSQTLYGSRRNDSDLCLDCLILEHQRSFGRNLLHNVYGSVGDHQCQMTTIKDGHGRDLQVCSDSECPVFKSWKIVDSGGAGWKVDAAFSGCFPPPHDIHGSSCFMTSGRLCSKEQLVDLEKVGLSPRIMDEIRPDIEVTEWYCGRGDSTSRYGFKVSLLDSRQLMMYVYGECKTLRPPESSRWHKVSYTFRDYEPGVRYVLFHHGGMGEFLGGPSGEGEPHPGSKMAAATVRVKQPRRSR